MTDPLGHTTTYQYDALDQLIEVKQDSYVSGLDGDLEKVNQMNITRYERDLLGRVISVTDAENQKETYAYDVRGQLVEKLDKDGYLTKYAYTKQGDVANVQYADSKTVAMSYNALRQLTQVSDWLGATKIEVNPLGRTTKVEDHNYLRCGL